MSEQQPLDIPQSPASEKAYLAAIIAANIGEGALFLDSDEFAQQRHQLIYSACSKRLINNEPLDAAFLTEALAATNELDIVTEAYIEELAHAGKSVTPEIAEFHARTIRAKYEVFRFKKVVSDASAIDNNITPDELQKQFAKLVDSFDTSKSRLTISRRVELTTADELRAIFGEQKWLWEGYIPVGHVTGLMAQQGQGKSNAALDICHRLALGLPMPDGTTPGIEFDPTSDKIFYLDAEGFLQTILSRMSDWQTPNAPFIWPKGCNNKLWTLNTPSGWAEFESIIAQYRPKVVVIDSLSGANNLEEKDNDQMKGLMQKLVSLASRFGIAIILVHHIRKASPGEPSWPINLDRARGASAITQFCRVVLVIGTPDTSDDRAHLRRLDTIKNNLAPFSPALGFEIHTEGLAYGEAPEKPRNDMALADAEIFLCRFLKEGARPSHEVYAAAHGEGIAQRTIERAKKTLNVKHMRNQNAEGEAVYLWHLPPRTLD